MAAVRLTWSVILCAVLWVPALTAQEGDRIWGRVETADGSVSEGFLRWGRAGAAWADLLPGTRAVPREHYRIWSRAWGGDEEPPRRVVHLMGFRISWNEDDPDFPLAAESGIRFGHVREVRITETGEAILSLRSGEEAVFQRGWTGPGGGSETLGVASPGSEAREVDWDDVVRVTFASPPAGAAAAARLHGTVQDRWGGRHTGYLSWDLDELLASDVLDGTQEGRDREIPFREITSLEREWDGTRVTFQAGGAVVLDGSNDVGRGHRGVAVSDPSLGVVTLAWDDVTAVRLHPPERSVGYDAFDGGHRLRGEVVTRAGAVHVGAILWDADEAWSWEILDGSFRDVGYDVEFGAVAGIRRQSSRSALVTLRDGRSFELEGSNDVGDENKGIFVRVAGSAGGDDAGEWILVTWDEFSEARFHHE